MSLAWNLNIVKLEMSRLRLRQRKYSDRNVYCVIIHFTSFFKQSKNTKQSVNKHCGRVVGCKVSWFRFVRLYTDKRIVTAHIHYIAAVKTTYSIYAHK